jgi:hypothetical protein
LPKGRGKQARYSPGGVFEPKRAGGNRHVIVLANPRPGEIGTLFGQKSGEIGTLSPHPFSLSDSQIASYEVDRLPYPFLYPFYPKTKKPKTGGALARRGVGLTEQAANTKHAATTAFWGRPTELFAVTKHRTATAIRGWLPPSTLLEKTDGDQSSPGRKRG